MTYNVFNNIYTSIYNNFRGYFMTYQDLIVKATTEMKQLERDSEHFAYLNDFIGLYKNWKSEAYNVLSGDKQYSEIIIEFNDIIDSAIKRKMISKQGGMISYFFDCMEMTKGFINNKYIRYRLFAFCYTLKANELVVYKDGSTSREQISEFISFIRYVYLNLKYLFRGFASTEEQITQIYDTSSGKYERKMNINWGGDRNKKASKNLVNMIKQASDK